MAILPLRTADEFSDAASTPIRSGEKGATGRQAVVQCLADGHLDLLGGRPDAGGVEDRPHRVGDADAFADTTSDDSRGFVVVCRVTP